MRLSRKTLLAVEAVLDIAYFGRLEPIQAKEITARQGVPQRHLEQAMQHLVHRGVLKGVRGPRGGYRLARERRRITVGEIVLLMSELESADEIEAASASCLGQRVVGPLWDEAIGRLLDDLAAVTVEELCRRAEAAGVERPDRGPPDFTI